MAFKVLLLAVLLLFHFISQNLLLKSRLALVAVVTYLFNVNDFALLMLLFPMG